jgi:periplasmic copper chaperone A
MSLTIQLLYPPEAVMRIITRLTAGVPTMRLLATVTLLILPSIALANPVGARVQHAWSPAMPACGTPMIYLTFNDNGRTDTLGGVPSFAARAQRHEGIDDHGVMMKRSVGSLNVAPEKPVTLAPNGYHIILVGLEHPLVAGTALPVIPTFAHAGRIMTMAGVQKLGAAMPAMGHAGLDKEMPVRGMASKGRGGAE